MELEFVAYVPDDPKDEHDPYVEHIVADGIGSEHSYEKDGRRQETCRNVNNSGEHKRSKGAD